ncbi:MAG: hypothetical protein Q7U53_17325 [Anaerolineaceae bacterium]|nr:hypothetical protein [Anaerolineaceae bacterium]
MAECSIEELIVWCDEKDTDGHSLGIKWSGGGGDGGIEFLVDAQESTEPQAKMLTDMMSDAIGYGWWVGNNLSSGYAKYNPDRHLFKGKFVVNDFEDLDEKELECNIPIRISKSKIFHDIHISIDGEELSVSYFSDSGESIEEDEDLRNISKYIEKEIFNEIESQFPYIAHLGYSYGIEISREDFEVEGNDLVYTIEKFPFCIVKVNKRFITLDLQKLLDKSSKGKQGKEK